jgi:hypothetical protein
VGLQGARESSVSRKDKANECVRDLTEAIHGTYEVNRVSDRATLAGTTGAPNEGYALDGNLSPMNNPRVQYLDERIADRRPVRVLCSAVRWWERVLSKSEQQDLEGGITVRNYKGPGSDHYWLRPGVHWNQRDPV